MIYFFTLSTKTTSGAWSEVP